MTYAWRSAELCGETTPKRLEPLRAEPSGFLVHQLSHSVVVSLQGCDSKPEYIRTRTITLTTYINHIPGHLLQPALLDRFCDYAWGLGNTHVRACSQTDCENAWGCGPRVADCETTRELAEMTADRHVKTEAKTPALLQTPRGTSLRWKAPPPQTIVQTAIHLLLGAPSFPCSRRFAKSDFLWAGWWRTFWAQKTPETRIVSCAPCSRIAHFLASSM